MIIWQFENREAWEEAEEEADDDDAPETWEDNDEVFVSRSHKSKINTVKTCHSTFEIQ